MEALVLGLVQVDLVLRVRREDLAVISMKELVILMSDLVPAMNRITDRGYWVQAKLTTHGVMT